MTNPSHVQTDSLQPGVAPDRGGPVNFAVWVALVLLLGVVGGLGGWLYLSAAVLVLGGLGVLYLWPEKVYLLFLVALPFSLEVHLGGSMKADLPTEVLIPVFFCVVLARCLVDGRLTLPRSGLHLPVVLFALYPVVTLAFSRFPMVTAKAIARDWVFIAGGYGLALLLVRRRRMLSGIWKGILVGSFVLACYGLFTQLREGIRMYQTIAPPFFQTHSIYATYIAFCLTVALGVSFSPIKKARMLLYAYIPFLAVALIATFTRGAWIGVWAATAYFLWVYRKRVPLGFLVLCFLALAAVPFVIAGAGLSEQFIERFERFLDPEYSTNFDRIDRWHSAVAIWKDHPIFGAGWGTYGDEYQLGYIYNRMSYASYFRMGAHNLHLEHLADGGIIAAGLFLWILVVYFREAHRIYWKVRENLYCRTALVASFGAMLTYLIHGQVNNLGPSDKIAVTFWFLLALPLLIERIHHRETEDAA